MEKKISRRQVSLFAIFSLLLCIGLLTLLCSKLENFSGGRELVLEGGNNIPQREISGSFLYHDAVTKKDLVYTIGDASSEISISELDFERKKISHTYYVDIKEKILEKYAVCTTKSIKPCKKISDYMTKQWEALYVDPDKRIFLLNESLGTILVYDERKEEITHSINLSRFTLEEKPKADMTRFFDENSLGEGFFPLNNGHILVVKESFPPSLIEFGPEGSSPKGFGRNLLVDKEHPYPFSSDKMSLEPLHVWKLPEEYAACDLSELTFSSTTGLSVLSQKCQVILELADVKVENQMMKVENFYTLPRTVQRAEAFVVLPKRGEFLVFEDKKDVMDTNFYFLSYPTKK